MAAPQAQSELGLKERFYRDFQREVTALQEQIERLNTLPPSGTERNEAIDQCLASIDRLSHEVLDASSFIPAYDQRSYSQTIKTLSEKLQNTRNSFNPPKKFSFKRKPPVTKAPSDPVEASDSRKLPSQATGDLSNADSSSAPQPHGAETRRETQEHKEEVLDGIRDGPGVRRPSLSQATKVTITNHQDLHLKLPAAASHATSSGTIANLQHCVIDLSAPTASAPFSALYLKNIKNSLIICGQVAGAIHITDVSNSILVISCRQFRMHGSKKVDIYLHSASRPIIEDCELVRFAPMPEMFANPEILQTSNHWSEIDDFKWLKVEASPNFSLLEESQRIKEEVWRDEVVGSEDLDGILKVLGIQ